MPIDFDKINLAALSSLKTLVSTWLPGGKQEGDEYVVKNPHRNDKTAGSFKVNTRTGIWSDFACSDVGGGDTISLYAFIFNLKQGESAIQLAKDLNIIIEEPKKPKSSGGAWSPIVPVPEDCQELPKKYLKKNGKKWEEHVISTYYKYTTKGGKLAGYTCLIKYKDGSKDVIPLTYCKRGEERAWKFKSFSIPRLIYNLHELVQKKDAQVLIVEGEKCADAGRKLFKNIDNIVVISWIGGSKGVSSIKWDLLKGRKVIFWPDADTQTYRKRHIREGEIMDFVEQPGASAMIKIYNIVKMKIKAGRLINPPGEYKDGWDIADAIESGWDVKKVIKFMTKNVVTFDSLSQKPAADALRTPFQCLGYNSYAGSIVYYFLPAGTHKVTALSAAALSKMNLLSLAPVTYWEREYPHRSSADYTAAANDCIRQCEKVGIYDPNRCRGRGAWFDNGRTVLHLGNKLIVNTRPTRIDDIDSYYIYEAEIPAEDQDYFSKKPLTIKESRILIEISDLLSWENSIYSKLFAGWIMLAPICGAIEWRPHIWITGESQTGKSWIQDNIITQILGRFVLNAMSNSTEAGIRQHLKNDAFPVRLDELETDDKESFQRVQRIIELARQSSSNKSASIIKGTAGGKAVSYCIRSCFVFSSINPKLLQQADESRITILKLVKRADYEENNKFDILRGLVIDTLTDEYCQRLRARAIKLIPNIRENYIIFSNIMSKILKSKRQGDQIGSLLAGAFALKSDDIVSIAGARSWADKIQWRLDTDIDDRPDQQKCLDAIMQQVVKTDTGTQTDAIGSLIRKASRMVKNTDSVEMSNQIESDRLISRNVIRKYGITTIRNKGQNCFDIAFAENHTLLKKLLENTPWNNGYKLMLMRIPGAVTRTATFADKRKSSAIVIPYMNIFPEETDGDEDLDRF